MSVSLWVRDRGYVALAFPAQEFVEGRKGRAEEERKSTSQIRTNGYLFPKICLGKGTRKDCLLISLLIFKSWLEPLACAIRQSYVFHGIKYNTNELLYTVYCYLIKTSL